MEVTDQLYNIDNRTHCSLIWDKTELHVLCFVSKSSFRFLYLASFPFWLLISFQGRVSLPILQFMPCWEGSWYWLFPLHDLQLLPGHQVSEPQMLGEKFRNKLPHLLWFPFHIKCGSERSTLWPLHAFCLLSGLYNSKLVLFIYLFFSSILFSLKY